MTAPIPIPHIARHRLTELDYQNLRAAKQQVAPDALVQLVPAKPGDVQGIAFGYSVESESLPAGTVWHCVSSAHHSTMVPALRAMIFGLDDEWQEDVWNVGLIGGK